MNGDKLTRYTAVAAVIAVAAVAALISYRHAVDVVTAHGEPGAVGRMYPVVIDGLIVAASMVLLDAARHRETAPALAWWMLAAGIGATLAVNVLASVPSGPLGAVVAAWPAAAFVGCYELSPGVPGLSHDVAPEASTGSFCNTSRGCGARSRCCSGARPALTRHVHDNLMQRWR